MEKLRELIEPGYKAFNGYVFKPIDCEIYNRVQTEINRYIEHGAEVPADLLDHSHLTFGLCIGLYN